MNRLVPSATAMITVLLGVSGCITPMERYQRQAVSQREDMVLIQEDIRRIEGRLEGLEMETERIRQDLDALRSSRQQLSDSQLRQTEAELSRLESRIDALQKARAEDRDKIIRTVSDKVASLVNSQSAPARRGSRVGVEHVVQPGETLSEIAGAYGVRMNVIVRENNLKNPDSLRVGQALFIPE